MARESTIPTERLCGMEVYGSKGEGIGGTLKQSCEDFVVRELYHEPKLSDEGRYLLVEVEKTCWETHMLAKEMAKRLHVSHRRIGFAGTKDRRARTTQLMSIYGLRWEDVQHLRIRDVSLRFVGYAQRDVGLGDLVGNEFSIRVRGCACEGETCEERIATITHELEVLGGAPSFFGHQRFGTTRPITHEVGRLLVMGDVEAAVMCYIAKPFAEEPEEARLAREHLWEAYVAGAHEQALKHALHEYPTHLRYERAMLDCLISGGYEDAVRVLPKNLQHMLVHAFQSYLFNRFLSERIRRGVPLNEPQVGEWVRLAHGAERVEKHNLSMARRLARLKKAEVCLPLVGYDTDTLPDYAKRIMEEEGVEPSQFRLSALSELSSKGTIRPIATSLPRGAVVEGKDVVFEFVLSKGCYATSVLREYTKSSM